MTDKEYSKQKKRVQKYIDRWHKPMGMSRYRLHHNWARGRKEDASNCAAQTDMRWEYQEYDFTWYLPALAELKDEELDDCVVHEFCHALVSPLQHEDSEHGRMVYEHVITTLQRAFTWTREAGKDD